MSGCSAHLKREFSGDRPRQTAYEIKLMLSRVSGALAQICCNSRRHRAYTLLLVWARQWHSADPICVCRSFLGRSKELSQRRQQ